MKGISVPSASSIELKAMGVEKLAVVYDEKEDVDHRSFPAGVPDARTDRDDECSKGHGRL